LPAKGELKMVKNKSCKEALNGMWRLIHSNNPIYGDDHRKLRELIDDAREECR